MKISPPPVLRSPKKPKLIRVKMILLYCVLDISNKKTRLQLCDACQRNQSLKMEKLRNFEPVDEVSLSVELRINVNYPVVIARPGIMIALLECNTFFHLPVTSLTTMLDPSCFLVMRWAYYIVNIK
jgi:Uncharacterized conserved protein (DUF2349).